LLSVHEIFLRIQGGYRVVYFSALIFREHWLTDVLGGYLMGALFLALLIVLCRWTLGRMTTWYEKRHAEKATQNQQV
jgi:membrane-associated phospholipid phosphatase